MSPRMSSTSQQGIEGRLGASEEAVLGKYNVRAEVWGVDIRHVQGTSAQWLRRVVQSDQ